MSFILRRSKDIVMIKCAFCINENIHVKNNKLVFQLFPFLRNKEDDKDL